MSWRYDQLAGLQVGLWFGAILGPVCGLLGLADYTLRGTAHRDALMVELMPLLIIGFIFGLMSALLGSQTLQTALAWLWLQRSSHVPTVSLMPFLEDALTRGVLRTAGGVYQFRHATLQDQLAGQTTLNSAAVSRVL